MDPNEIELILSEPKNEFLAHSGAVQQAPRRIYITECVKGVTKVELYPFESRVLMDEDGEKYIGFLPSFTSELTGENRVRRVLGGPYHSEEEAMEAMPACQARMKQWAPPEELESVPQMEKAEVKRKYQYVIDPNEF